MKIAINGFGRIGRMVFRAFIENKDKEYKNIEIVAVNDLAPIETSMYLLKYDSVHGNFSKEIQFGSDNFSIDATHVKYFSERNPENLPWRDLGVDVVLECTGVFKTKEKSQVHLNAGAKKVIISCPATEVDKILVVGVNDDVLDKKKDDVISCASCTTNCLAPAVKVIHETFGIESGFATTIHSYTADQRLVDSAHTDLRRARAAAQNIIPTTTGVSKAIAEIFPDLKGKLSALSIRVPTPDVSLVEFIFNASKKVTVESINDALKKYADGKLKGILSYTEDSVVSSDLIHSPFSSIADLKLTRVSDDHMGHIMLWYDNEWGFSNRMLDASLKFF